MFGKNSTAESNGGSNFLIVIAGFIFVVLYFVSLYSYPLFHSLAEIFSIIIACSMFIVAWNSRHFFNNNYLLFIGITYLFVGFLDLLHTLAYRGMNIFIGFDENNLPPQIWIVARYMEAISIVIAPWFFRRKLNIQHAFLAYLGVTVLLLGSIFYLRIFPDCFITGQGLTTFKKVSEYVISALYLTALWLLHKNRDRFDPKVLRLLTLSICFAIVTELFFTIYINLYGISNLMGHYAKIFSFYFMYLAIIKTALSEPYNLLFRDLKQSESALTAERDFISAVLDTESSLLIVVDTGGHIVRFNHACEVLTGYSFSDIKGKTFYDLVLPPEEAMATKEAVKTLKSGGDIGAFENYWLTKSGDRRLIAWSTSTLAGADGKIEHLIGSGIDITEQRKAEDSLRQTIADKEMLIREVHHRVKNNLMVISSLLSLQSRELRDAEAMSMFKETETRVKSISMIHERLYKASSLSSIDISEYIRTLSNLLFNTYRPKTGSISLVYHVQDLNLDVQYLLPCGLILNELVSNALKHAFKAGDDNSGRLEVRFEFSDGVYTLSVVDNGKGLPAGFDIDKSDSLGMKIVMSLVSQLEGKLEINSNDGGTDFKVTFKEKPIY